MQCEKVFEQRGTQPSLQSDDQPDRLLERRGQVAFGAHVAIELFGDPLLFTSFQFQEYMSLDLWFVNFFGGGGGRFMPTTAISATPGWPTRMSSTSFGEMFSPLRMMMSLARPVTTR